MSRPFHRIADDNDVPAESGTYRRVLEYWADHCERRCRSNTYWAELCCPGCGKVCLLGSNHVVGPDSNVTPSVVCPYPPCTFHEFITLDDWNRPSTPKRRDC